MKKFVDGILKYYQVLQAFMVLAVILVVFSFLNIPDKKTPKFIVNQGIIVGVYPGATSAEVEEKLTKKVKEIVFSYKEVDKNRTQSISKDGTMIIYVELTNCEIVDERFWIKVEGELADLKLE